MHTRYVDITIDSANRTRTNPGSAGSRPSSGVFVSAVTSSGTTSVSANDAFRSGSSQHGKLRRASVASKWVVMMTCSAPASSV